MKKEINGAICIHNPLDFQYKSLLGAVSNTAPVLFCIDIRKDVCADVKEGVSVEVYFVIRPIDGGESVEYKMQRFRKTNDYIGYSIETRFTDTGIYLYHFEVRGDVTMRIGVNDEKRAEPQSYPAGWQLSVYTPTESPDWQKGGVMYHIFVDRFYSSNRYSPVIKDNTVLRSDWGNIPEYKPDDKGEILNNDFFGGNLQGITEKLLFLKSLNVTMIYLSPVFEAFSSHKYDTADYTKIDGMFGSEADFKALCENASKMGVSIILDGVFNHTGNDSVYFSGKDGASKTKSSPYLGWYNFQSWPDLYSSWWNFKTLPSLNAESEELYGFFNGKEGIVARWLDAGARGWRLDVVDEIKDKMLDGIVASAKAAKHDALIVGEVWEDASGKIAYDKRRRYFLGGQLDSVTNYPLRDAIISFVREGNKDFLSRTMFDLCNNYPKHVLDSLMNILGTHDTERILTALGGESLMHSTREVKARARMTFEELTFAKKYLLLASVLQYTLPGFPCVYYGDEAGMQGYCDPFNRRAYPWGNEDASIVAHYARLGEIRSEYDIFKEGYYHEIPSPPMVYAFERVSISALSGVKKITVVVNRSAKPYVFSTDATADLLSGRAVEAEISIEPLSSIILLHEKESFASKALFNNTASQKQ